MTMKIAAGICEYADPDGLYRCLASLGLGTGGIDLAIVIHGKFAHFDLDIPDALQRTEEIISRFPAGTVHLVNAGNPPFSLMEVAARSLYLKVAAEQRCDWLLVIDTDEYLPAKLTDWTEFRRQLQYVMDLGFNHQIFDVQLEGSMPSYRGPQPRLFYLKPGAIKYYKKHYWFVCEEQKDKDGMCTIYKGQSDAARVIGGIVLVHDHTIRDSKYYNASIHYKEWQQEHE